ALNEANRRLPKDVEIVGVVDSDYVVNADWPRAVVDHFADPKVAFVQTPQNYRDWSDDQYLRGLYYSYQYFFEITMPSRAHRNAIIFAGTMGLIRLLAATAFATAFPHQLPIRTMTGAIVGLPVAFLATGLLRAVWAMKLKTKCTWRDAIAGLQVWFALSWVVTLDCVRGLLRFH